MPPSLGLTENYYKILASEHPKIQIYYKSGIPSNDLSTKGLSRF